MVRAAALLIALLALLLVAAPASAQVKINEVESDGSPTDWVEVVNTGAGAQDMTGWTVNDETDPGAVAFPATTLAAGGFLVVQISGLGDDDAARIFDDLAAQQDSYAWTSEAAESYGRCPDGTGAFVTTVNPTPGTANDCPPFAAGAALPWPGGSGVSIVDTTTTFSPADDVSGLAYQPSGTSAPGVLWATRNGDARLFRLLWDGTKWAPDTANGWSTGKTLEFPGGGGLPDAEGVTLAGGDPNGIYVSIERDDSGAPDQPRPGVLRFDITPAATTLVATDEWNLAADFPAQQGANAGLEAVTWIPDDVLVAKGFVDQTTGFPYNPADYGNHGTGVFFVGVEQGGQIHAYVFNPVGDGRQRIATIPRPFQKVMALEYEAETRQLWAACDDTCDGRHVKLDVAQSGVDDGRFVVAARFERPSGMTNFNNEGFAITPQAECVNGLKPVFWADDSATTGNVLRAGTLNCTVPTVPDDDDDDDPGQNPTPPGNTTTTTTTTTTPPPAVLPPPVQAIRDGVAPRMTIARLRLARTFRRTGRLSLSITLNERANLVITATARRNARSRARRLIRSTRRGVAAGRRAQALTLSRRVRRALRRGETVTITIEARDAAGNLTTRRVTARVP